MAGCGKEDTNHEVNSPIIQEVEPEPLGSSSEQKPGDSEAGEAPVVEENPVDVITERKVVDGKMQSYLTGEWKDEAVVKRRPAAIMIPNNAKAGYKDTSPVLRQYGTSLASIIYEAPVEGRITRLMGVFEDYDQIDKIGPIRSCRDYYCYEAMAMDAVYVNWGASYVGAPELLNSDRIDNISANVKPVEVAYSYDPAFYRDSSVNPNGATEFTGFLKTAKLTEGIDKKGYRKEYSEDFEPSFLFAQEGTKVEYADCPDVTSIWPGGTGNNAGGYGNYGEKNVHFEYDPADGLYHRYQYGNAMTDAYNDEAITVTNVVFKICHGEERFPDDPSYDYLAFACHGTGDAIVFTNGKMVKGTWQHSSDYAPNKYFDENGKEIVLNQGKTWVCIIWKEFADEMLLK